MFQTLRWIVGTTLFGLGVMWFQPLLAFQPTSKAKGIHTKKKAAVFKRMPPNQAAKQGSLGKAPAQQNDQDCDTGCASHGKLKTPARSQWMQALLKFAKEPLQSGSPGLETLLFHGDMSRKQLTLRQKLPLPQAHIAFLAKELRRTHARIAIRIRTENGIMAASVTPQKVQIGHHFHLKANKTIQLQVPSFGGRIERVGLKHLWVRI